MEGIDASRLTLQLIDVCRYTGATYERIEEQAPLLLELPATQHAHEVLFKSQAGQRPEAARQVLECVIRPDGAARLNQRDSRLVAAYLGLNGATGSLTARLDDLDNDSDYLYGKAPATRTAERRKFMRRLAAALVALDSFPCAPPSPAEEKLEIAAGVWAVLFPDFVDLAPEEQDEQIDLFFRRVKHARAVFDEHEPMMSIIDRLKVVMRAVAVGPYRRAYDTLSLADREAVLSPDAWLDLLDSTKPVDRIPTSEEFEQTSEIMTRVVLDIESDAAWERVLLVAESERDPFELSNTQMLRIQALIAKFSDDG